MDAPENTRHIDGLLAIMRALRSPDGGCPWDLEQDFASIAPYTIEEAYEVVEAIRQNDMTELKDELGDLLLQVVFHAQMADEAGLFSFDDVVQSICDKMIRRHPHVFGDAEQRSAGMQAGAWEQQKAAEAAEKNKDGPVSVMDGVPLALPALSRAVKLQRRAARIGFDWKSAPPILEKLNEEMRELTEEVANGSEPRRMLEELGDILFVYANLARHLKLDPEEALTATNVKFERRFRRMETIFAEDGKDPKSMTLADLDAVWDRVKREERGEG